MRIQWWLRSTTGSYGRSLVKIAYEETMIHSTEAVWEILLARKEWLGCRHDASPMLDIPGSTPIWAQYMIFFYFHNKKVYMYYVLKINMYYKRNTGGLWRCPGPTTFKERFNCPLRFLKKSDPQIYYCFILSSWFHIWFMY